MAPSSNERSYPISSEQLMATLAELAAAQGEASQVAVLSVANGAIVEGQYDNWNGGTQYWTLRLEVPPVVYAGVDREAIARALGKVAGEVTRAYFPNEIVGDVELAPTLVTNEAGRADALQWLRGEGITNQGRVRSDNIAPRQHDGLLFRSVPEVHLYYALKARGVSFAPLPVFIRGGETYRRIEPDFVILHRGRGAIGVVEGDTVHRETPADAQDRTLMMEREGARVLRVRASECETPALARACAERVLTDIAQLRSVA